MKLKENKRNKQIYVFILAIMKLHIFLRYFFIDKY